MVEAVLVTGAAGEWAWRRRRDLLVRVTGVCADAPPGDAQLLREMAATQGLQVEMVQLDVDWDKSVEACFSELPPIDVLVNNAGLAG